MRHLRHQQATASRKRRLFLATGTVTMLAAVATLVSGVTFGLFSATESSGGNSFTAGTVAVTTGSPTSVTCTISTMVPGDSSAGAPIDNKGGASCTYNVKYTGTTSAYVAVDVAITNGTPALYDDTATGLQLYLKDATPTTYLTSGATDTGGTGTTYTNQTGTATTLPAAGVSNLLVSTAAKTNGATVNFTLDYAVPLDTGNAYQGGSATVTLTFHAVQSGNNPLPSGCTAAGRQCNSSGGFSWS